MLYYYSRTELQFKHLGLKYILFYIIFVICLGFLAGSAAFDLTKENRVKLLTEEERLIVIHEYNQFTQEKLVSKIKELNIRYPHIVLGQAMLETGFFTSKIFRENNNLFGMREAKQRITTAKGTENNHAYYTSWQESLLDYSFYQCRYLSNIQTEEQYFQYLEQSYAEDTSYVPKLKSLINKEQLKVLFNNDSSNQSK